MINSSEVLLVAETLSGTHYRFREYERGKWEMLRDGDKSIVDRIPNDKWVHIQILPVIEQGSPMIIYLGSGEHIRTTPVTFVGRNN